MVTIANFRVVQRLLTQCNLLLQFICNLLRSLPSPPLHSLFPSFDPSGWGCVFWIFKQMNKICNALVAMGFLFMGKLFNWRQVWDRISWRKQCQEIRGQELSHGWSLHSTQRGILGWKMLRPSFTWGGWWRSRRLQQF